MRAPRRSAADGSLHVGAVRHNLAAIWNIPDPEVPSTVRNGFWMVVLNNWA